MRKWQNPKFTQEESQTLSYRTSLRGLTPNSSESAQNFRIKKNNILLNFEELETKIFNSLQC